MSLWIKCTQLRQTLGLLNLVFLDYVCRRSLLTSSTHAIFAGADVAYLVSTYHHGPLTLVLTLLLIATGSLSLYNTTGELFIYSIGYRVFIYCGLDLSQSIC